MPRLFSGLELPFDLADTLSRRRGALRGARWMEPSDYHITLRFLGDVEPEVAETFHGLLVEARLRPPLEIVLDGLACFGGDRPRALYASVAANSELADLQAEHERLARQAGADPEPRRFTPHVTLARLRREADAEGVAAYLSENALVPPLRFTVTRVALFSAKASKGGGPYLVEAAYPLGEDPA